MKNIGCHWPKLVRFEIRDAECNLLAIRYGMINSYNDIMPMGRQYALEAIDNKNYLDESYWSYEVLK